MTERQQRRFDNGTPNNPATDALYQNQGMYNLVVHAEIGITTGLDLEARPGRYY